MAQRVYRVEAIDLEGGYRNEVFMTRDCARYCKKVLKSRGYRSTTIYKVTGEGSQKIY